jgi:hypothetical protein
MLTLHGGKSYVQEGSLQLPCKKFQQGLYETQQHYVDH